MRQLLLRRNGATLSQLQTRLGWQPHTVRGAMSGALKKKLRLEVSSETVEGRERYPVNLRYPRAVRDSLEKLRNLPLVTPQGQHIPLRAVADLRIEEALCRVDRGRSRRQPAATA